MSEATSAGSNGQARRQTGRTTPHAQLATSQEAYERYGLKDARYPEVWEDGMRTTGERGTWEWWYFDGHLDDGSTVVIVFYTKQMTEMNKKLTPYITLEIDRPDGTHINRAVEFSPEVWSASKTQCDVKIADNFFRGDLETYTIHFADDELTLDIEVKRETESWRPATGHIHFGSEDTFFAWVVAVPQGQANVTLKVRGETSSLTGSCYHDHNWGTVAMIEAINHWYWARTEVGPYTVIASEIIADAAFNSDPVMVFNLARGGKTVADDQDHVTLYRTYGRIRDSEAGKPVSDKLLFTYEAADDETRYELTLEHKKTLIIGDQLKRAVPNPVARGLVRLVTGFTGAYYRFTGEARLKVYKGDDFVEEHVSPTAVWELMHFGAPYQAAADAGLHLPRPPKRRA